MKDCIDFLVLAQIANIKNSEIWLKNNFSEQCAPFQKIWPLLNKIIYFTFLFGTGPWLCSLVLRKGFLVQAAILVFIRDVTRKIKQDAQGKVDAMYELFDEILRRGREMSFDCSSSNVLIFEPTGILTVFTRFSKLSFYCFVWLNCSSINWDNHFFTEYLG